MPWLARRELKKLIAYGVSLYFGIPIAVSAIELAAQSVGFPLVAHGADTEPVAWWDILYFNMITILTVGYGDFNPISFGKALSVIEAFVGVVLFSVAVAVFTVKALMPPANAIVFSKRAFYSTDDECFLIAFVNTTDRWLGIISISSYFKLGGDWGVRPHITAPLLTKAVQTFYVDNVRQARLIEALREGDCLRVGIDAKTDFSSFSAFVEYSTDNILVTKSEKAHRVL